MLDTYIPTCNKIVTSLPYSIIEPFINKLLKCQFEEIIMITGKKYAEAVVTKKVNDTWKMGVVDINNNVVIDFIDGFMSQNYFTSTQYAIYSVINNNN